MGKFAKDSVTTSVIIAIGFLFGTITGIFVYPKLFSKADQGIFRYLNGWGILFAQFCSFGIGSAAMRTYYRLKDVRAFGELNMLLLLVPMAALLLFIIILLLLSDFFLEKTLNGLFYEGWAVIGSLILITIAATYTKTYQGIGTVMRKTPVIFFVNEILLKIGILAAFLLFFYGVADRTGFLFLLSLVYLLQMGAILYITRSFFRNYPLAVPSYEKAKPIMKLSWFCLIDNSASLLVAQIDLMMVGILCANSLVKIQEYGMALQVAAVIFLPWRSFSSTSIPFIAEAMSRNDFSTVERIYRKTSLNLTIFGLAVFILIFASIDNIIAIIPDNYSIIKYPVLFIGLGKIIDMMGSVNGNIISLSPYYKMNLYLSLTMLFLLLLSNLILIPVLGITGSAIATAVSLLIFNFLRGLYLYNKYKIQPIHFKTPEVLLFMGLIFTVGMLFPDVHHMPFINLCIRSIVLTLLMYGYISIRKPSEDIERLRLKTLAMVWKKKAV